jgi:spore maturation protein CgeB
MIANIQMSPLQIAAILDPFSFASFASEADFVQLRPDNLAAQLSSINPDLLFVESAWHGVDGLWFGKICDLSPELSELITLCKESSIPTVFWCKEDPVHFDRFLLAASLFDYVFTTDIHCIPLYKQALGHSRVGLLPFACQPLVHNPVESFPRKDAVSYAGSFYRRFPDRVADTETLLGSVSQIRPLDIFDRYFDSDDENYRFPEKYQQFIRGALPLDKIDQSYKGYRYGINLNTVKNSESMFARRTIELLASGTITISNNSSAFPLLFGDVILASDDSQVIESRFTELVGNNLHRAKLIAMGVRKAMQEHTYAHRLATIAQKVLGITQAPSLPSVLVLLELEELSHLDQILSVLNSQNFEGWRALLMTDSGLYGQLERMELDSRIQIVRIDAVSGQQIGSLVDEEAWVTQMTHQDYYGPNYLLDLILATRYSDAQAFGKAQFFESVGKKGEPILQGDVAPYQTMTKMDLRSSVIALELLQDKTLADLDLKGADCSLTVEGGVSLDYLSYCRNANCGLWQDLALVSQMVDDLEINAGISIEELYKKAETLKMVMPFWLGKPGIRPARLAQYFGDRFTNEIMGSVDKYGWHIVSQMRDGEQTDLLAESSIPLDEFGGGAECNIYLESRTGLDLQWVLRYEQGNGDLIEELVLNCNEHYVLVNPPETLGIRFGLRIKSSGSSRITRLVIA